LIDHKPMIVALFLALTAPVLAAPPVDYGREVKPILRARCTSCHGAIRQKAGLRLDTAEFIRRGSQSGRAIEPGESGESLMIDRVTAVDGSDRMPPESEGAPLNATEVATLRTWIDQGAHAPPEPTPEDPRQHWAYQPPVRPGIPQVAALAGMRNPIDAFLSAGYRAKGLKPSPLVSRDVWLRRTFLDLIGLPPTREERKAFLAEGATNAAERLVDRLLADPRHGERWGRHWMDVWRYSDWYGLGAEIRYSHPHIWQWRDWIVASVNTDKGYNRMIEEMLAGDEIAPEDPATLRATGFLVRNWDIFNRNAWLANTVEHTARAFLGVTIQCARCHDHKFDPVSQTDYYRLRAFFEPYQIRIDRVPGQPDRTKAGLARVFDDFLETPTFLFVRGDEATPDKSRPMTPAIPAVLGGSVKITPIPLAITAAIPDKRDFVVREAVQAAEQAVTQAVSASVEARKRAAQAEKALAAAKEVDRKAEAQVAAQVAHEDAEIAMSALGLAQARRLSLKAVLHVEALEDQGAKERGSEAWVSAAREAHAAQCQVALLEARSNRQLALRDLSRVRRHRDGLLAGGAAQKNDSLDTARAKAATDLVQARARVAASEPVLAKAEAESKEPITTAYTPRPLEFPRAKITYRDIPSNAPYSRVSTGRRLALARWIVDRRNPLTARVAVNHVWARHFGEPLVASSYDFGLRTPRPEHQALLDWLAVEFIESGWSFKHLHKLIVTSRAYRMRSSDSGPDDPNVKIDPDNRYVWRTNLKRMEAEVVRDSVLFLAGRLDPKIGGPEQPVTDAETGTRRTIYYRYASGDNIPILTMFDAPNVTECYRRHETIVPQQALAMINSGMVLTRARDIAGVIDREMGSDPSCRSAFVDSAFERIFSRVPTEAERSECLSGLVRLVSAFTSEGAKTDTAETRARSAMVHVLLNHNDFVTIR
jgi:hypothetical protein